MSIEEAFLSGSVDTTVSSSPVLEAGVLVAPELDECHESSLPMGVVLFRFLLELVSKNDFLGSIDDLDSSPSSICSLLLLLLLL